jgi:hypothetical protein
MENTEKTLLIHHHLGVGDSILCNGLVRFLLANCSNISNIIVCSWEKNKKSIERMYDDDNRISVLPLPENVDEIFSVDQYVKENNISNFMRCGFGMLDQLLQLGTIKTFDEAFYICANVPFEIKWTNFYYRRNLEKENSVLNKLNPHSEPYIFVHDDVTRGYTFEPHNPHGLPIMRNDLSESIFDMGVVLEKATEIHCMESSFRALIDHLPDVRCPLFFYPNIRAINGNVVSPSLKKQWNTIT